MESTLAELAVQDVSDPRSVLLRKVTEQVAHGLSRRSDAEIRVFAEIVRLLYPYSPATDRAYLSEALCVCDKLPDWLVQKLIEDQLMIAAPILSAYRGLTEHMLLGLATKLPDAHLQVIARRDDLTFPVSDTLVGRGSLAVHRAIAGNVNISLSKKALHVLVQRVAKDTEICDALLLRSDLTASNYKQMLPFVDNTTRQRLRKLIESALSPEQREHLQRLRNLRQTLGPSLRTKSAADLWTQCEDAGASLDEVVTLMLQDERLEDIVRLLAHMGGEPEPKARDAIFDGTPQDGARVCLQADLNLDTFSFLATVRAQKLRLPPSEAAEWRRAYQALQQEREEAARRPRNEFAAKRPKRARTGKANTKARKTIASGAF